MAGLFQKQASTYAKIRPTYPTSMFQMLANLTPKHQRAWDVGTGNGQAAAIGNATGQPKRIRGGTKAAVDGDFVPAPIRRLLIFLKPSFLPSFPFVDTQPDALAELYESVVATDLSEEQLSFAFQHPKVTYSKMSATPSLEELERVVGKDGSVDLVTVAQAMHWFDLDNFYVNVKHVLRNPGGVIAAWCYGNPTVTPEVDSVIHKLYSMSGPYWAPQIKFINEEYRTIPFPFKAARDDGVGPHFVEVHKHWTLEDFMVYWKSCSAVQTALDQGVDLCSDDITKSLVEVLDPAKEVQIVTFHLRLLVGSVESAT